MAMAMGSGTTRTPMRMGGTKMVPVLVFFRWKKSSSWGSKVIFDEKDMVFGLTLCVPFGRQCGH
jgi:hypothetical protein